MADRAPPTGDSDRDADESAAPASHGVARIRLPVLVHSEAGLTEQQRAAAAGLTKAVLAFAEAVAEGPAKRPLWEDASELLQGIQGQTLPVQDALEMARVLRQARDALYAAAGSWAAAFTFAPLQQVEVVGQVSRVIDLLELSAAAYRT